MKDTMSPEDQAGRSTNIRTGQLAVWIGLPAVALLLGVALAFYMTPGSGLSDTPLPPSPQPVVAVLPLIDLEGSGHEAFNQGFIDEIGAGLTMVQGLELRGRSSARTFTDVNRDAGLAGALVGASVVLDATSQRSAGRIRVVARLIDTRSGAVVWSGVQDTTLAEWFAARDAIVEGVSAALGLKVGEDVRRRLFRRRTVIDAFELYSMGRFGWAEGEGGDLLEAISYYDMAIAADSNFAPVWTALARAYVTLPRFTRFPVDRVRQEGAAAARTALLIDPDGAGAHAVMGEVLYLYERDYSGGRVHLERALELDPGNGDVLASLCELAMVEGRLSDAEEACRRAVELDVFAFRGAWLEANLRRLQGRYDESLAGLDTLRSMFPDYVPLSTDVLLTLFLIGDTVRIPEELQYWLGLLGGSDQLFAEFSGGNAGTALRHLSSDIDPAPSEMAALGALLGEYPLAVEAATRAVRERDPGSLRFAVFPEFARLQELDGFQAVLKELNLVEVSGP
jgi:TolB-like protein